MKITMSKVRLPNSWVCYTHELPRPKEMGCVEYVAECDGYRPDETAHEVLASTSSECTAVEELVCVEGEKSEE